MPPTVASRGGVRSNWPSFTSSKTVPKTGAKVGSQAGPHGGKQLGVGGKTHGIARSRHRKILRDTIHGITKPAIRRLARRGGVKRISATIYEEARTALKERLEAVLRLCVTYVEYRGAQTVTVDDVVHALKRFGRPIYGFEYMNATVKLS